MTTPQPCDREIFKNGQPLLLADTGMPGGAQKFEQWVQSVANASGQRVDWHYSGGIAQVLFIGDRDAIVTAVKEIELPDGCCIMRWEFEDSPGLYRKGVTPVSKSTIAGFMDPLTGEQTFIVEEK